MKRLAIMGAMTALLALGLASSAVAASAGGSSIQKHYLDPVGDPILYPDGIAKVTLNCDTGDFVLRAHGLSAGDTFVLRSRRQDLGTEIAVGNGMAGLGNNVLVHGNISPEVMATIEGGRWNLFLEDRAWQVLRSGPDDPIDCVPDP